jgi:hypothetical protein
MSLELGSEPERFLVAKSERDALARQNYDDGNGNEHRVPLSAPLRFREPGPRYRPRISCGSSKGLELRRSKPKATRRSVCPRQFSPADQIGLLQTLRQDVLCEQIPPSGSPRQYCNRSAQTDRQQAVGEAEPRTAARFFKNSERKPDTGRHCPIRGDGAARRVSPRIESLYRMEPVRSRVCGDWN